MILYSNSCSFGAPTIHKIYPELIADTLGATLVNAGKNGSCNRRIIRSSLRDLIELKEKNNDNIVALIGLTFISRTELWQPWLPTTLNDGDFHSISIDHKKLDWSKGFFNTVVPDIHKYADTKVRDYYKAWLTYYDPEAELTNLISDLIMFTGWCKLNKISYKVFSNVDVLPQIDNNAPFISSLILQLIQDPDVIDLWNFSFGTYALSKNYVPRDYELYGNHGHPGEEAHIDFANHFLVKYINV